MDLRFLSEARAEFDDAALYYESARPGLGNEFLAEMDVAVAFIEQFPDACPPSAHDCRHKKVHRFPYNVVFSVEDGEIVIVAVMHVRRDPAYWHKRVQ